MGFFLKFVDEIALLFIIQITQIIQFSHINSAFHSRHLVLFTYTHLPLSNLLMQNRHTVDMAFKYLTFYFFSSIVI